MDIEIKIEIGVTMKQNLQRMVRYQGSGGEGGRGRTTQRSV